VFLTQPDRKSKWYKLGHLLSCNLRKSGRQKGGPYLNLSCSVQGIAIDFNHLDKKRMKLPAGVELKSVAQLVGKVF